ncbi:D-tyrosyl-tRNA(Tyr) deacylase [Alloscardovia macacae]|uniref:D-aminoacyl-tRNA deacylase n=1 Tax=Alloscardovia macacae TaxID=1160091 RepID=A0A1Y2SZQ5_9BIFI|nr:D-aminoacyl-tRNA deacylase [Alloscardovia macacae]OTA26369.1 D-tyrosyl-tRNA(Tyr) deacylase [Alloscardovia macacae]OTA28825.1 D-tyrosyl-tRNA(Tyr) deacylase [Alloscardovia macacae]
MRVLLQKVSSASVRVESEGALPESVGFNARPETERSIGAGLVLFVGVQDADDEADVRWMAKKVAQMRIFADSADEDGAGKAGRMNRSVLDVGGSVLSVSQFTLYANIRRGNRPSFVEAGEPEHAREIWEMFGRVLRDEYGLRVVSGVFGAHMDVALVNDGPVTIWLDSAAR